MLVAGGVVGVVVLLMGVVGSPESKLRALLWLGPVGTFCWPDFSADGGLTTERTTFCIATPAKPGIQE